MFVTVEGPVASGKTTLSKNVVDCLRHHHAPAMWTCEPTQDSVLGKEIRLRNLDPQHDRLALTMLYLVDRLDHKKDIEYYRQSGILVCDRYSFSTLVYQFWTGWGMHPTTEQRYLRRSIAEVMSNAAEEMAVPDLTIIVDTPLETCLDRVKARGGISDVFEKEGRLREIHEVFRHLSNGDHGRNTYYHSLIGVHRRVARVDGSLPEAELTQAAVQLILEEREQHRQWQQELESE